MRESRQLQIEQDELRISHNPLTVVRTGAEQIFERLHAVAHHVHPVGEIGLLERMQRKLDVIRVVLDQKNVGALFSHDSVLPS